MRSRRSTVIARAFVSRSKVSWRWREMANLGIRGEKRRLSPPLLRFS
jgi:hypothetical protein